MVVLTNKACHIVPRKYRCPILKSGHVRPTYLNANLVTWIQMHSVSTGNLQSTNAAYTLIFSRSSRNLQYQIVHDLQAKILSCGRTCTILMMQMGVKFTAEVTTWMPSILKTELGQISCCHCMPMLQRHKLVKILPIR